MNKIVIYFLIVFHLPLNSNFRYKDHTSWNQYLGNTKTACYKDQFIPSNDLEIKVFTKGNGIPCPTIISESNVYFGTSQASAYDNPISHIYAFNKNKTLKWEKRIKGDLLHSMAVSKGVLVVVPTENDYIYGLNTKNGDILWKTKNPFPQKNTSTAPIIDGDLVYINVVLILDIKTGMPINDNYTKWNPWSTFNYPVFIDSSMFASYSILGKGGIVSLDKSTGKQKWNINGGYKLINQAFNYKDTLYVGQRYYGLGKIPLNNPQLLEDDWYDVKTTKHME